MGEHRFGYSHPSRRSTNPPALAHGNVNDCVWMCIYVTQETDVSTPWKTKHNRDDLPSSCSHPGLSCDHKHECRSPILYAFHRNCAHHCGDMDNHSVSILPEKISQSRTKSANQVMRSITQKRERERESGGCSCWLSALLSQTKISCEGGEMREHA